MGILHSLGISKGTGSAYNKINKIILNHYQNYQKYIATDIESYNKSQNSKQSAEFELFSLLGKDENTLNLLNKYNLTITYLEELYNRIIEEGGGQEINGKFIPILAMTDLKTLTYLIENLRAKDLSSRDDNITKIVGKVVMHYHYGDDL